MNPIPHWQGETEALHEVHFTKGERRMNEMPLNQPVGDPAPTTAEEAFTLLRATEALRMKERDKAAMKLAQSQAREMQLREQLDKAQTLVVKHHSSSYECVPGLLCPVCSPCGNDKPFNECFSIKAEPPPVVPLAIAEQLAEALEDCNVSDDDWNDALFDKHHAALAAFEPFRQQTQNHYERQD